MSSTFSSSQNSFRAGTKLPPFIRASHDIRFKPSHQSERNIRLYTIPLLVTFFFLVFSARLFHLTIVKGAYYQFISENNRIREVLISGKRGDILDRKGRIIATSDQQTKSTRIYKHGEALAHLIGYRQIASSQHIDEDACPQALSPADKIGAEGIERLFECHLRPTKGKRLAEIDAHGKEIRTISEVPPVDGLPIKLSIDSTLQSKTYDIIQKNAISTNVELDLTEKHISVVAMEPSTGEILLLLSNPTFDPADFENATPTSRTYIKDKEKPLFNRPLKGTYPPGSVFKPFVAAGALEDNVISESDTITDNGFIQAGPQRFHNWFYTQYGRTDGEVDLRKGLQRSNDIYFYKVGEALKPEGMKKWAHIFGFGQKTGIALDDAMGTVPTEFWKQEVIGERWYLGDTYNFSIGQGYLLTTPLQIATATSAIANGGQLCEPQLIRIGAQENKDVRIAGQSPSPTCKDIGISESSLKAVREGMKLACESGGTAWPFFEFHVDAPQALPTESTPSDKSASDEPGRLDVGCKTGTAEAHIPGSLPHAWFTIFAPYNDPEIVLTVLVEQAGEGSSVAAPLAKEILKAYFEN